MLRSIMALGVLFVLAVGCSAADSQEIFRLRVENRTGGCVQVSLDEGKTYSTVGHVSRRATITYPGFPAAAYVPDGTVAATAIHGIRLKVGTVGSGEQHKPVLISLVPVEFREVPQGYGGHIPHESGIYTDIPAGTAIFRNFAPFAGSSVKLERNSSLVDLPKGWQPSQSDVIVIIARLPRPYLRELEFENRAGGTVTARYDDGREERIATVMQPVGGVGRFDGTSYTGTGLINTNHGGVVTISTAPISRSKLPEGEGDERRGGFQILPSEHAKTQYPAPQAMVIGPVDGGAALEGRPPIFSGFIGLAFDPADPNNTLRAEVSIRGGPWEPMPQVLGRSDGSFTSRGVTGIRLLFPRYDREFLARSLAAAIKRPQSGQNVVRGLISLKPSRDPGPGLLVTAAIDDQLLSITSQPPYDYLWDTKSVANGEHKIRIRISDAWGNEVETEERRVIVDNP